MWLDIDSPRDTGSPEDPHAEAALGLGELAGLTVNNDAETHVVYDVSSFYLDLSWLRCTVAMPSPSSNCRSCVAG